MDKKEIFEMVVSEMTENAVQELRETSEEQEQLCKEVGELAGKRQAVLEKLSPEDRQVLEDYLTKTNLVADHDCQPLYVQGAKDCGELLKKLGVL